MKESRKPNVSKTENKQTNRQKKPHDSNGPVDVISEPIEICKSSLNFCSSADTNSSHPLNLLLTFRCPPAPWVTSSPSENIYFIVSRHGFCKYQKKLVFYVLFYHTLFTFRRSAWPSRDIQEKKNKQNKKANRNALLLQSDEDISSLKTKMVGIFCDTTNAYGNSY